MNIRERLKTDKNPPLKSRTIIHVSLVYNKIQETITAYLKPFDVSLQQFNVLRILRGQNGNPANLQTLNERMITKSSNTTRLVDKLILKDYVDRAVCPANRRKVEIRITKKGLEALSQIDMVMQRAEDETLKGFSPAEMEALNLLLNKF